MTSEWINLGKSLEDYLERILLLGLANEKIRVTDLAEKLGVKKPSVVSALKKLAEEKLIIYEKYRDIILTDKGREYAGKIYRRHLTLTRFFYEIIGVEHSIAESDACSVEHEISMETFNKIFAFIEYVENNDELKQLIEKFKQS
ncbi:MAG: hypothetical protein B6226_02690 [Candidatus Cloacimonetes bacterium 4572_65]|nr:MAG: hypothetical protein B6226_02690 [Candidatus Cloacimonetes bacterium 4572_65]